MFKAPQTPSFFGPVRRTLLDAERCANLAHVAPIDQVNISELAVIRSMLLGLRHHPQYAAAIMDHLLDLVGQLVTYFHKSNFVRVVS